MAIRKPVAMTDEELRQMAIAKFAEAATLPPGPEKQKLLISAGGYLHAAHVRSWLASDLHPPK
jgi:hypothetical protein